MEKQAQPMKPIFLLGLSFHHFSFLRTFHLDVISVLLTLELGAHKACKCDLICVFLMFPQQVTCTPLQSHIWSNPAHEKT